MNRRLLEIITRMSFVEDEHGEADAIFLHGTSLEEQPRRAAQLFKRGLAPRIIVSGGHNRSQRIPAGRTETALFYEILKSEGVPESAIFLDECATHTLSNAINTKILTDKHGWLIRRAIIVSFCGGAVRTLLSYQTVFPETEFMTTSVPCYGIDCNNWQNSAFGRRLVFEQLRKIGEYAPGWLELAPSKLKMQ